MGDNSKAATGSGCQATNPLRKANATASDRLATLNLERGVYLIIPLEASPDRTWSESPLVIAPYLIEPAAVAYWSALHYWHMTEQIPRVTFVQSTERKRAVEIQGVRFQFVNIKKEEFFSLVERTLNGKKFHSQSYLPF